jgi:drug/metabolite transporter (DMT)-like permease
MNYVGVALAAISGIFYVFVKPDVQDDTKSSVIKTDEETSVLDRLNPNLRRIFGVCLSIFAGVLYGLSYAPFTHLVDNYENASKNALDYVFSTYCGTLVASIVYYLIYTVATRNNPYINIKAILPSFMSGCMWGVANCCFLYASSILSQSVTFPIG